MDEDTIENNMRAVGVYEENVKNRDERTCRTTTDANPK